MTGVQLVQASQATITMGIVGTEVVVGDVPIGRGDLVDDLVRRMKLCGVERIVIERAVTRDELSQLVEALASIESRRIGDAVSPELPVFPHIRL